MKRLIYSAGIALTLFCFSNCAQHDTKSPDTSGNVPNNQPGAGVDTVSANAANGGNSSNTQAPGSNNNGTINTGDSSLKKQ